MESAPHPTPEHLWTSMLSSDQPPLSSDLQQLLVDTAEFDTVNLFTGNSLNDSSIGANGNLDDELMSLWMAAPTDFT
jgi:hypothetical protein